MKSWLLVSIAILSMVRVNAQKPPIDLQAIRNWPGIESPKISNNGNYVAYTIDNVPAGSSTLVIKSIREKGKKEFVRAKSDNAVFTPNGQRIIFISSNDSLCVMSLENGETEFISHISSFKVPKSGSSEWLAYKSKDSTKSVILRNLLSGSRREFKGVTDFTFSDNGKILLLQKEARSTHDTSYALQWINLEHGKTNEIWHGGKASYFIFDSSCTQLAFIAEENQGNSPFYELCYYAQGMDDATSMINEETPGIDTMLSVENSTLRFSRDGNRIFFLLKLNSKQKPNPNAVKVDIWSYSDARLQSEQLSNLYTIYNRVFQAVFNIRDRKVIRLEQFCEQIVSLDGEGNDDFVLVKQNNGGDENEWFWNVASQYSIYLISTKDGSRKLLRRNSVEELPHYRLSPKGKYVIYYDPKKYNYFSYEIATGITRNITQHVAAIWADATWDRPRPAPEKSGLTIWLENDTAVLINDQYDIWMLDPAGRKRPVNITNNYGRKHKIEFNVAILDPAHKSIKQNTELLLEAFNTVTKENGFYRTRIEKRGDPEKLTMGPYLYDWYSLDGFGPMKARDSCRYLLERMKATESPDLLVTANFKNFEAISNIQPQRNYNWLIDDLFTWKTFDGSSSTGILYKPENFDPKKKYPVIFYFYQTLSDQLNVYIKPTTIASLINIPYYVSNGYLVCTPDIHYKTGEAGESAYNSIVSAAKYLSKMPWVDSTKLGIQGHSFGGYEVNYLITHTSLFAAAASGSGLSDLISSYGSIVSYQAISAEYLCEIDQNRIGATLWQCPDLYVKNSPIFRANKVTTPLLMMANKGDIYVPYSQGIEFFMALRRLGKKAWLLQYDNGQHILVWNKDREDYTIRLTQFFNHYLKDAPPAKWMTEGVPAKLKGIEDGYGLDLSGKQP